MRLSSSMRSVKGRGAIQRKQSRGLPYPSLASGMRVADLKEVEDMLPPVLCAWVAIRTLEGHATP
jgi:hypothetical protein